MDLHGAIAVGKRWAVSIGRGVITVKQDVRGHVQALAAAADVVAAAGWRVANHNHGVAESLRRCVERRAALR